MTVNKKQYYITFYFYECWEKNMITFQYIYIFDKAK